MRHFTQKNGVISKKSNFLKMKIAEFRAKIDVRKPPFSVRKSESQEDRPKMGKTLGALNS